MTTDTLEVKYHAPPPTHTAVAERLQHMGPQDTRAGTPPPRPTHTHPKIFCTIPKGVVVSSGGVMSRLLLRQECLVSILAELEDQMDALVRTEKLASVLGVDPGHVPNHLAAPCPLEQVADELRRITLPLLTLPTASREGVR